MEEIIRTVDAIDRRTQQHAALLEQPAAASRSMAEQTVLLSNAVAPFKTARRWASVARVAGCRSPLLVHWRAAIAADARIAKEILA